MHRHCDGCGKVAEDGTHEVEDWRSLIVVLNTGTEAGSTDIVMDDLCPGCQRRLVRRLRRTGWNVQDHWLPGESKCGNCGAPGGQHTEACDLEEA